MIAFTTSVAIERSPSDVFAVLTDFEHHLARWAKGPVAAKATTPGDIGVGTRFAITARVGPFRVRSPYVVTAWTPPEHFGGRGVAGPVRFDEEYRLSGADAGTVLEQTIRAVPRGGFRLIERVVERQLRRLIPADLQCLKALLEAQADPPASRR